MGGRHVFVHVGDTHLQHGHERNADRLDALDQIIELGVRTPGLAAWIWPGDLFHTKSTPEDRLAIARRLQSMATVAPVLLTVGNHDLASDVEIFAHLESDWQIHVATTPQVVRVRTPTGADVACFLLPYAHKAGLVGAGVAQADISDEAGRMLEAIFMGAAAELADAAKDGALPMMAGHLNVGGAVSSVGQPQIGREIELNPALLARLGHMPKALNHIHRHQEIDGAVYAGSISRMDFGEQEQKGYVEWTYHEVEARWAWRFVPIATPAQVHVDGRLTRDRFEIYSAVGADPQAVEFAGADVRCRYRYLQAEAGIVDTSHIHAIFRNARSLKLEGIPELEHQVRAPEIAAAVTLEQKVKLYAARHGIGWTPAMDAKLAQLQAHDGDALTAAVAHALALMTLPKSAIEQESAVVA